MAELLFEIFCEEIPARMQTRAGADLSKAMTDGLKKAGLSVDNIQTFTGPRRLVYVADIPLRSPDISEERKGPRVGSPEQALAGFMRGAGLSDISEAEIRNDPKKGEHYVAIIEKPGSETSDILSALIPDVMNNFPWPKSMKSGSDSFRWVRPLQSLICLLDGTVVPVSVGGVTASNITEGHRRHGKGPYEIKDFAHYKDTLESKGHVVLSSDARKEIILEGNARVLSARLADAQFFQSEDAKQKLIDNYDKLGTVMFHKDLGSIRNKAERVAALARELAPHVGANADKAEQAAKLAKCDLVTNMVIEFTSLQGQIGAQMYRREGGDADIATAIEQHYKPQGPSDNVPTNPVAVAVALADKLDTLVGFWAIDEKPTGSKDPFALRRAALGVVRIVLENGVRLEQLFQLKLAALYVAKDLNNLKTNEKWDNAAFSVRQLLSDGIVNKDDLVRMLKKSEARTGEFLNTYFEVDALMSDLLTFILDRLRGDLRDKGVRHDIVDAAFAASGDDLVAITNRVSALQSFLSTDDGGDLLAGYKRAANILKAEAKKGELPTGAPTKPADSHGGALFDALQSASPKISKALEAESFEQSMLVLANLKSPISNYFR